MLSTAAPDFWPGSASFGIVGCSLATLVSGRLGGVRCRLPDRDPSQARGIGRVRVCGRLGLIIRRARRRGWAVDLPSMAYRWRRPIRIRFAAPETAASGGFERAVPLGRLV